MKIFGLLRIMDNVNEPKWIPVDDPAESDNCKQILIYLGTTKLTTDAFLMQEFIEN